MNVILCLVSSVLGLFNCTLYAENVTEIASNDVAVFREITPTSVAATTHYYISSECYGAITKEALNELVRNLQKNDIASAKRQLARGELVPLDEGTSVEMVNYGLAHCKVRITSGKYKGKVVFVITEFIGKRSY